MKYDSFENETYNLYTIETAKFKSGHLEVVWRTEATRNNITYLALLIDMLFENSKNYPSRKLLMRKMYDLYNVSIVGTSSRVGNTIVTNAVLDFIDPKYIGDDILEDAIALFFDMIFEPNVDVDEFDEQTFERVKKNLRNEIESLKEDPKQSSIMDAFKEFDSTDVRSFNASGEVDILDGITPKKLYDFYKKFIEESARDIYLIGNLNMKSMNKMIKKYAKFKSIAPTKCEVYLQSMNFRNARNIVNKGNVTQTNLVQLYAIGNLSERERDYVMPLFNMIWGSGSLESKLYKALRRENSLCYNVNTFYQKYDKVLILHTAIDDAQSTLALKLINKALTSIKKGDVDEDELNGVKNLLENSLNMSLDDPSRLIDTYVFKNLTGLPDIEKRIDEISSVTVDEIVAVCKKIKLVMTYRVRGE